MSRGKSSLYHSQSPKLHFCQIGLIISWYWLVTYQWTQFTQNSVFHKDNVTEENLLVVKLNFLKQIWTSTNWKFNRHYHHLFHPLSALFRYHKLESKRNPPLKAMGINVYEKGLEVMLLCSLPVQHSHDKIILAVQEIHSIPPTSNMSRLENCTSFSLLSCYKSISEKKYIVSTGRPLHSDIRRFRSNSFMKSLWTTVRHERWQIWVVHHTVAICEFTGNGAEFQTENVSFKKQLRVLKSHLWVFVRETIGENSYDTKCSCDFPKSGLSMTSMLKNGKTEIILQ